MVLAPDGLERIIASWQREAADGLLSVQPFHVTLRGYEQLSAYPNLMAMMASGGFAPRYCAPTDESAGAPQASDIVMSGSTVKVA